MLLLGNFSIFIFKIFNTANMKNNYSSIQNMNKTAGTILKQFFIAIVLVVSASFNNAFADVVITAPPH